MTSIEECRHRLVKATRIATVLLQLNPDITAGEITFISRHSDHAHAAESTAGVKPAGPETWEWVITIVHHIQHVKQGLAL